MKYFCLTQTTSKYEKSKKDEKPKYPSKVKIIDTNSELKIAFKNLGNYTSISSAFYPCALPFLSKQSLSKKQVGELLNFENIHHDPNLVKLITRDIKENERSFGYTSAVGQLTFDQLLLLKSKTKVGTDNRWIEMCFARLKPLRCGTADFNSMNNDDKNEFLDKLLKFCQEHLTKDVHNRWKVKN